MNAAIRLLAGKTAAIIGDTTGIGRAITLEYLRQGANVAVNHLGLSKDEPVRRSLVDEAKRLRKEAPEGAPSGELLTLEITGDVTRHGEGYAAARQMVKQGKGGAIISISYISALVGGGLHTPTKAALLSMTKSMAIAPAKDKIRVNALVPGTIHNVHL